MGLSINYINNHASEIILAGLGEGRGGNGGGAPPIFHKCLFCTLVCNVCHLHTATHMCKLADLVYM